MRLPPFMRNPWWWLFYVLALGGAIGMLVTAGLLGSPPAVWQSFIVAAVVGSAGMLTIIARSKSTR